MPRFTFYQFWCHRKDRKDTPTAPRSYEQPSLGTCGVRRAGCFLAAPGGGGKAPPGSWIPAPQPGHPEPSDFTREQLPFPASLEPAWTGWVWLKNRTGSRVQLSPGLDRVGPKNRTGSHLSWTGSSVRPQVNKILRLKTSQLNISKITLSYSGHSGATGELNHLCGTVEERGLGRTLTIKGRGKIIFPLYRSSWQGWEPGDTPTHSRAWKGILGKLADAGVKSS